MTTTLQPLAEPTTPRTRFANLDVLRGVAILGTLGTNIWFFTSSFDVPTAEESELLVAEEAGELWGSLDAAINTLSYMATNGKFLALLSILFGVGMAIQFDAAERKGLRWPWRYEWRTLLLFLDGLLHYFFVVGFDILMGYALTAFFVAPMLRLRGRQLCCIAAGFAALHVALEIWRIRTGNAGVPWIAPMAPDEIIDPSAFAAVFDDSSYWGQVVWRYREFWFGRSEAFLIAPPLSATLFLVGAILWRSGVFRGGEEFRHLRRWLVGVGFGIGLPATVFPTVANVDWQATAYLGGLSRYTVAPIVAIGYLGLGLVLMERGGGQSWIGRRLADVGKMALSCYMLQNVIASIVFLEFGIGLGPLGAVGTVVAWAVVSGVLLLVANMWLRRFPQGPFETVWRRLADAPFDRRSEASA
jgi:uncharacterized protein